MKKYKKNKKNEEGSRIIIGKGEKTFLVRSITVSWYFL